MDYAMLSRHSIQSTSDQEDYVKYAAIAAGSPAALTPEQSAVWSYPLREGDDEEVIFNMVNSLLLRVHQSGHLAELTPRRRALVKEALDYYKSIRACIPQAFAFWPLGMPDGGGNGSASDSVMETSAILLYGGLPEKRLRSRCPYLS